jgi:exodeoxyribonuclease VII large subunit
MSETTNDSSPETPWSVLKLSEIMGSYIDRLGSVWIEAEVTQWGKAAGNIYGKFSDPDSDASLSFTVWRRAQENIPESVAQGDRVIARVKPSWWVKGGTLSMNVLDMRHTGLGEILEKLQKLKTLLASEGLFDESRKKPLPFLPGTIGLVTGKDSDAEKDVVHNATLRWPDVTFRIEYAAVQGDRAVPEIMQALQRLDSDPKVDVIIVARGGGDFLNLLPFSDEALVRLAASLKTPLVSAIGHEADRPLLDDVADLRASTPTDAAKRVVPDIENERQIILEARARLDQRIAALLEYEIERLAAFVSRPILRDPFTLVDVKSEEVLQLVVRGVDLAHLAIERATSQIHTATANLRGLSPTSTLERGYAIARLRDGTVVSHIADAPSGEELSVRVADGTIETRVL